MSLNNCEDIHDLVSSTLDLREYLEPEEEIQIHRQFRSSSWRPDCQILWSGMLREQAQSWADERGMQTLTTAMGPLMDPRIPSCVCSKKSSSAWRKYIHGASAVFAWHIAMGDVVTVLCPPPPQRFHPSGRSNFQLIEEPILRAAIADGATLRIDLAHPRVKGAENFRYQLWPRDDADVWIAAHGSSPRPKFCWRLVKGDLPPAVTGKSANKAAPENPKSTKEVPPNVKQTAAGCQAATPKKSKKKRKKAAKKQASCAVTVNLAGGSPSSTKSETSSTKENTTSTPESSQSHSPNAKTYPVKKARLSKREITALKETEANIEPKKATKKAKAKAIETPVLDMPMRSAASTAIAATPSSKALTLQEQQARKEKKMKKATQKQQKRERKATKAKKKRERKLTLALQRKQTPVGESNTTKGPKSNGQGASLMDDAIAAMQLQYQLDFGPEARTPRPQSTDTRPVSESEI